MGYPGATIYLLSPSAEIRRVAYEETDHYQVTKDFLDNRERYFKHLFREPELTSVTRLLSLDACSRRAELELDTAETRLVVREGLLESGNLYFAVITASAGDELDRGSASVVTSLFEP
jgi:hypothetical protein